jgi:hypothetical protein
MNKKLVFSVMLICQLAFVAFFAFAQNNPETDFRRQANDRGGVTITGYEGQSKTVVIPSRLDGKPVTDIKDDVFSGKQLTSVTIPNSVTSIGELAFRGNQLTNVTIPNSVTRIGYAAFSYDQMTSITIGANVSISQNSSHGTIFFRPTDSGIFEIIAYDNSFETAYQNSGKKEGTYVQRNGSWAKQ